MKILVTGGAGFMGSHLVDALVAAGHAVTVFDRAASRHLPTDVREVRGDLSDATALTEAVAGQDAVYHMAGFADLNAAREAPLATAQANLIGTLTLLEVMRAAGVMRFLFASTVYVYSREGGFYRCSKQACESYIEEHGRTFGLRYTVLRYGSLYGPRADTSNGVYRLLATAMAERKLAHAGDPGDLREYIHVEDAARLSVQALAPEWEGQHVVLTGPTATRIGELFTMFGEILGTPIDVSYQPSASGHYAVTPYAYTPKPGRKLVATSYVDMGQGLLRMVEEIDLLKGDLPVPSSSGTPEEFTPPRAARVGSLDGDA